MYPGQYNPGNPMGGAIPGGRPGGSYGFQPTQGYPMPQQGYPGSQVPSPYSSGPYPAPYGQPAPQPGYGGYPSPYQGPGAAPYNSGPYPTTQPPQPFGSSPVVPPRSGSAPTFGYPTVEKIQFTIPKKNLQTYANLYSIIAAAEALGQQKMDGSITDSDYAEQMKILKNNYDFSTKALKMNKDQVEAFCETVNLGCSFALVGLYEDFDTTQSSRGGVTHRENMELGSCKVEIQDHFVVKSNVQVYLPIWDKITRIYKKTSFLQLNSDMRQRFETCDQILRTANPQMPLPDDKVFEFKSNYLIFDEAFVNSLDI
ncbi:hypothetical protein TVAG_067440 [Trichomonas vaginalis G3]|uniref:Uncharacterized protein n=1 Tax=Trichomonas vaginalis (strain ATCC PRA-98 / G3) TaxID=412133 RepID=A2DSG0_TRIV3|nr:endosomal sorting complex assembly domain family [Trichomonas vaginalis G3]EAY16739.1 hypothetical protein TVAG_067440 [Trichomonas vaginalis G3]KAI5543180.1 endosomal sorting complex assembly domain family [Trichomonas vaginalis G3]|eukprot:XP_001328962.1 hypothetical protein [Trichomonas vaginalis G3]